MWPHLGGTTLALSRGKVRKMKKFVGVVCSLAMAAAILPVHAQVRRRRSSL
jgi:hypothetical protein